MNRETRPDISFGTAYGSGSQFDRIKRDGGIEGYLVAKMALVCASRRKRLQTLEKSVDVVTEHGTGQKFNPRPRRVSKLKGGVRRVHRL